jgi:hypothetical protein
MVRREVDRREGKTLSPGRHGLFDN